MQSANAGNRPGTVPLPPDEQPSAAIAVDWGCHRISSASKRCSGNSRFALLNGRYFLPKETFSFAEARTAVRPKRPATHLLHSGHTLETLSTRDGQPCDYADEMLILT